MKAARIAFGLVTIAAAAAASPGCHSQTEQLCSKICDCQHCNTEVRATLCDTYDGESNVANDYGCSTQYTALVQCGLDHGNCNDNRASFTTSAPGSCTGSMQIGSCTGGAQCGFNGATCQNGRCIVKVCSGNTGPAPCTSDADCTNGNDLCTTQTMALQSCVKAASKDTQGIMGLPIP